MYCLQCVPISRQNVVEMRQLLQSINKINLARANDDRFFESHVIFDGGIRNKNISEFALQLLTLLKETLGRIFISIVFNQSRAPQMY